MCATNFVAYQSSMNLIKLKNLVHLEVNKSATLGPHTAMLLKGAGIYWRPNMY